MSIGTLFNAILGLVIGFPIVFSEAAGPLNNARVFVKRDRWCAIGDSITHGGNYHKYIYLYYATRFPQERFSLFNCGSGGDTAAGTLWRMDPDILIHKPTAATIMLGMNDVWATNNNLISIADYGRDLEAIVDRLAKINCCTILLTPSIYDQTVKADTEADASWAGLDRFAVHVRQLAEKKGLTYVDFFNFMTDMTKKIQAEKPGFTLIEPDRAHPKDEGHFVMAYKFLKDTGHPALVSKLQLDAANGRIVEQQNCIADNLLVSKDSISFSLLEKSLPFPITEIPVNTLSLVPFTDELNQQILKINGLKTGSYELFIDNTSIGSYSAEELGKGLNLAVIATTPQNIQAKAVADLNSRRHAIEGDKLRYIAMMEYGALKKQYAVDDIENAKKAIDAYMAKITDPAQHKTVLETWKPYLEYKPIQSKLIEKGKSYCQKMFDANKPVPHLYRLLKS